MAGEINRVPAGLLSLLDMKARGQNPRSLSEQVSGSVELLDLYLLQNRFWISAATVAVNAPGVFTAINVPQNEAWYVNRVLIATTGLIAAGTEFIIGVSLVRQITTGGTLGAMLGAPSMRFLPGDRVGYSFEGPFLASPGDAFGVYCVDAVIGTATAMSVVVDATRLEL